jgi:hypothetical protein
MIQNKRRHKHIKLLKVTKREIEMFETEYYRRYNYRLNTNIIG